jgi:hypothetical protein
VSVSDGKKVSFNAFEPMFVLETTASEMVDAKPVLITVT